MEIQEQPGQNADPWNRDIDIEIGLSRSSHLTAEVVAKLAARHLTPGEPPVIVRIGHIDRELTPEKRSCAVRSQIERIVIIQGGAILIDDGGAPIVGDGTLKEEELGRRGCRIRAGGGQIGLELDTELLDLLPGSQLPGVGNDRVRTLDVGLIFLQMNQRSGILDLSREEIGILQTGMAGHLGDQVQPFLGVDPKTEEEIPTQIKADSTVNSQTESWQADIEREIHFTLEQVLTQIHSELQRLGLG